MKNLGGVPFVAAALVFGVSAVAFGATAFHAFRVEEVRVPTQAPPDANAEGEGEEQTDEGADAVQEGLSLAWAGATSAPPRGRIYPQVTGDEILGAVNQDIFQPDRTPPVDRYQLPSERSDPVRTNSNDRRRREPDLRIVGTAIAGDMALALVQPDDSIPFAVLQGEMVDGYLLAAVTEEMVTLVRDDMEFTFPVVEPQRGRSSNNRNRNTRNGNATEEAAQALSERVQQILQGRGQVERGGARILPGRGVQLQMVPGGMVIERGGQGGAAAGVVVRPRGGGGGGGSL